VQLQQQPSSPNLSSARLTSSSGSGDFYGTVGGKTPYIPQGGNEVKKTKDNVQPPPPPPSPPRPPSPAEPSQQPAVAMVYRVCVTFCCARLCGSCRTCRPTRAKRARTVFSAPISATRRWAGAACCALRHTTVTAGCRATRAPAASSSATSAHHAPRATAQSPRLPRYISDPIREPERKRATTADAPPAFKPPPSRSSAFGKIECGAVQLRAGADELTLLQVRAAGAAAGDCSQSSRRQGAVQPGRM
jgi:hypothetical protein